MPHYKDGTEVTVGDVVRWARRDLKDQAGEPVVFVGRVLAVEPSSTSCNVHVAYVVVDELPPGTVCPDQRHFAQVARLVWGEHGHIVGAARVEVASGPANEFEKIV